jgi:hypothetical protein
MHRYRSPWSNKYEPAIDDGFLPSDKLRHMEIEFNELFDAYRELYFEGGTSSVYLWDQDQGFAGCFLIKKSEQLSNSILAHSIFICVSTLVCCCTISRMYNDRCGGGPVREERVLGLHPRGGSGGERREDLCVLQAHDHRDAPHGRREGGARGHYPFRVSHAPGRRTFHGCCTCLCV